MLQRNYTPVCRRRYNVSVLHYAINVVAQLHPSMHAMLQHSYTPACIAMIQHNCTPKRMQHHNVPTLWYACDVAA